MFEYNTWVYYLAILLCGFGALVLNANQVEYSLIDATSGKGVKRQKQVYLVAFLLMGYIVFWAAIRNGIVDTAEYIYGYEKESIRDKAAPRPPAVAAAAGCACRSAVDGRSCRGPAAGKARHI